jgi:hypothetical protein
VVSNGTELEDRIVRSLTIPVLSAA